MLPELMRAALLLALTACWSESPKPATPPDPPVATPAPRPRWRPGTAGVQKTPDPKRTPEQIAKQLATDLRTTGSQLMTAYVSGPLVVLDLDAGTLTTECDGAAVRAAMTYGLMFEDPKRPAPHCRGTDRFSCSQFGAQQVLIVELTDPDAWRVVSVIVGNFRTGRSTMSQKMSQMRQQVVTAACP